MFAAITAASTQAAEWSAGPQVVWQSQHNTNPYLVHAPERTVTTHRLDMSVPLIGGYDATELRLEPQLHLIRTPHWRELDRDEYAVGFGVNRMIESGNYGVSGGYTRDTTLTSEFLDTGYVGVNKQRNVWSLEPYMNRQLSPVIDLMTALKFRKQEYQDAEATPLVGYEYAQANIALSHQLDERNVVRCGVDHSRVSTVTAISDDTGLRCSLMREMAEPLRGSLTLGGHRASSSGNFETQSRSGSLAALDLTYETADVRWGLRGSRSVEPSGYGLLMRTDQLGLTAAYNINESLWASASITVNHYVMTTPVYDLPERDYEAVHWRIVWQWLPEWTLEGGVNYARQRYDYEITYATATTLIVQLAYRSESN
jgi:hypothetical protein